MYVQYLGFVNVKSGKGKQIVLGRAIDGTRGDGVEPILVNGKYGKTYPYLSNERYSRELANVKLGEYLEVEFDPSSGYMSLVK